MKIVGYDTGMVQTRRFTALSCLLWWPLLFAPSTPVNASKAVVDGPQLVLKGDIRKAMAKNVSAIVLDDTRGLLVIGADEGAEVQVFHRLDASPTTYKSAKTDCVVLDPGASQGQAECGSTLDEMEVDIEGLARDDDYLYVVGSHSRARKSVRDGSDGHSAKTPAENRERLATIKIEPSRERLFRLKLDANGKPVPGSVQVTSLRDLFVNDPLLALFQAIPSKENGIDIEGLGVDHKGRLYFGFRGPVLRGGYALVLRARPKDDDGEFKLKKKGYKRMHINLGGRGIRGMSRIKSGFLLLAGPLGDGPASYQVWKWNGKDAVPGKSDDPDEANKGRAEYLCDIPQPSGIKKPDKPRVKAEGIAALDDQGKRFAIVYDSAKRGGLTTYRCPE